MRLVTGSVVAVALALTASLAAQQQGQGGGMRAGGGMQMGQAPEVVPPVKDGGIFAKGWQGKIDPGQKADANTPSKLEDSKLTQQGDTLQVETGPAVTYWNPANKASGDFTVKGTFTEPQWQNRMTHPHPYGVFIGGNDLGTDQNSLLYCEAYGDGTYIVRGFGPAPFKMTPGNRGVPNDAVHKAAAKGQPVTQEIAMSVKGDKVSCSINGTEVASYPKADVIGPGKLKSTDGIVGIRFAHNTEGYVKGFGLAK